MHRSPADAIAFLAPGLVHQFGNLLLTIQGHALGLPTAAGDGSQPADQPGRARAAILAASERGGRSLQLLRRLLGEPEAEPGDANELLAELVEVARVPVREARHLLEWTVGGAAKASLLVDACGCTQLFGIALSALVQAIPDGVRGTVGVSLRDHGATVVVRLSFTPQAGSLPFPLPLPAVVEHITAFAARQGHAGTSSASAAAIELRLPVQRYRSGSAPRLGLAES